MDAGKQKTGERQPGKKKPGHKLYPLPTGGERNERRKQRIRERKRQKYRNRNKNDGSNFDVCSNFIDGESRDGRKVIPCSSSS